MKRLALFALLAWGGVVSAQEKPPAEWINHWMHAHEEDVGGVKVYRQKDYKFPPSRGRTGFELKASGECTYYDIAPADGIKAVPGKWQIEGKDRIVLNFTDAKRQPLTLQVVSCDGKVMKVK